jgi:hypothetical protein
MNITNAEFQIIWDDVVSGAGDLSVKQNSPNPPQQGRSNSQPATSPGGCGSPNCIFAQGQNPPFTPRTPNEAGRYQNVPNPSYFSDNTGRSSVGFRSPSVDTSALHPETPRDSSFTPLSQHNNQNSRPLTPVLSSLPRTTFASSVPTNQRQPESIPALSQSVPPPPSSTLMNTSSTPGSNRVQTSTPIPQGRPTDSPESRCIDSTYSHSPSSDVRNRLDFNQTFTSSSGSGNTYSSGDTEKEVRIVIRGKHETCMAKMQEILQGMGIVAGIENFDISMGPPVIPPSNSRTDTGTAMQTSQASSRRYCNGPPPGPPNGGGGGSCSGTPGGSGNYLI